MRPLLSGVRAALLILAAPAPLSGQCNCPPAAHEEKAFSFGIEQLTWQESDQGMLLFGLRSASLAPNSIGTEFSLTATFAPYPFMFAEVGPILSLGTGPVSFLARFGIGAVVMPPIPEGYAGIGMLVRFTDRMGMRVDLMRRYFKIYDEWGYFQSVGISFAALTP